jgi:hypothetical protein
LLMAVTVIEFSPSLFGCVMADDNVSSAVIRKSREEQHKTKKEQNR